MDRNHGRRHVDRSRGGRGDHDGSGVGRGDHHLSVGGGGGLSDGLGARHGLVLFMGTGTEANSRAAGNANVEAGAGVVLAARAGATGAVVLAVDASAVVDSGATGDTDVVTGTSVLLAVAIGGGSVGIVTTKERKVVLECSVSSDVVCGPRMIHVARNLPAGEQQRRKRDQWPERGTERPRWRKCWKALCLVEYRARRNGSGEILKSG